MTTLRRHLLEPISALTHALGAVAALVGTAVLIQLTWDQPRKMLSLLIYGLTTVLLYTASALLHGLKLPDRHRMWLNRLDHAAIFIVIAGTYTPIVHTVYPAGWRWPVLAAVWLVAAAGVAYKLFSRRIHGLFNTSIYLVVGWGGVVPALLAASAFRTIPRDGYFWLLLGGLIYSSGFIVYYWQRPDPHPQFGHHEIWHLFVLGGSLCHYLFILWYIVPFVRPA